jgi:NRAMP (natural resistance-associated macrophage protein)-like metal ion transporter
MKEEKALNIEEKIKKAAEIPAKVLEETAEISETVTKTVVDKPAKIAKDYWQILGPGLTTGAADDDPSGIATYSQTGAKYGFSLSWLAALTFPLMAVVQEMCARIGLVTGRGLAANIRLHFPRWVLYLVTILLFVANTFNIGADLGALAEAIRLFSPTINYALLVVLFAAFILILQIFSNYRRYSRYLKYLALVLFAYILSTFLIGDLNWRQVGLSAIRPSLDFSRDQIILICGILGTTISPYLFFWQTSQEVEEAILSGKTTVSARQKEVGKTTIRNMRIDIWSGMFLSNLAMFFIITACAATLNLSGITNIGSAAQAAEALRPFAGDYSYFLFALGIIGVGLLGIPVLAGSAAYAMSESFKWREGLNYKLKHASAFYGMIVIAILVGLALNFVGLDPIKALIYSAVANGLVAPVILVLIAILSSRKDVMKEHVNGPATKTVGWLAAGIMTIAGVATIYSIFF